MFWHSLSGLFYFSIITNEVCLPEESWVTKKGCIERSLVECTDKDGQSETVYVPMIHLVWLKDKKVANTPTERHTGQGRSDGAKDRA